MRTGSSLTYLSMIPGNSPKAQGLYLGGSFIGPLTEQVMPSDENIMFGSTISFLMSSSLM